MIDNNNVTMNNNDVTPDRQHPRDKFYVVIDDIHATIEDIYMTNSICDDFYVTQDI